VTVPAPRPLVILGAIGNCLDVLDAVRSHREPCYQVEGFLDDDPALRGSLVAALPVLGPLARAAELDGRWFINAIGSPRNHARKDAIIAGLGIPRGHFATVVHGSAWVSPNARIATGSVVLAHTTVNHGARVNEHVMILPNCVIGHDSIVEAFATLASGVVVSGRVRIGRCAYLGAGSSVRDGVSIGDRALLGMGGALVRDMPADAVWAGNPARPIDETRAARI
jgi:sugar O-acyltransferase (sialic acid O-acetyltransferase NeuD family)